MYYVSILTYSMYLIFLGTLKISVCTIVYPLQNCIKYYKQKNRAEQWNSHLPNLG